MFFLCRRHVDPCGIDTAVSEDIRKVADVFMYAVVGAREEMAEVMWECFLQCNACFFGVLFHFRPDVAAVYRVSVFRDEDCAAPDVVLFAVVEQFHSQLVHEKDIAVFSFAEYADLSDSHCFHRDRCKFTDAHAGAADDLDDHGKAEVVIPFCSCDEFFVFGARHLLFLRIDVVWLGLEDRDVAVVPACVSEEAVQGDEHAVGARCLVVFFEMFFVSDHAVFGDVFLFLRFQPGGEGTDVADVFFDGILGFFLYINMVLIGLDGIFVDCPHAVSSYAVLIFCPRIFGETGEIVTVYWVILMRTIGMGELAEIGRKGSSKSKTLHSKLLICQHTQITFDIYSAFITDNIFRSRTP